ncbi:concanavalin A-like lectin/glucanase [Aspergillus sclerotioniger CBS 115572]|uniref:Concanavalin A-like lectin/glucanase n=1 Tax=Aspergillus sclerotioniger CBS 115572 TaxID=1450535 RepID=A0A317VZW5_9EURO|nr:concanavalin A-like lectin/glucanase [Aspergillus sclerotioniger CBS 115572]PWY78478.1 concanavalin A-like lectin/glucanase [Aspergillus sclerotioniger CBS 115572]
MKFTSSLALTALLAAPALAGPHGHKISESRNDGSQDNFPGAPSDNQGFNGQAQPSFGGYQPQGQQTQSQAQPTAQASTASQVAPAVTSSASHSSSSSSSSDDYYVNENWAGAIQETSGTATFSYVAATFTLPSVTPTAASSDDTQSASFWVGIDGATGQNQIWQAGVDIYVENGETSFLGWYEWYPADTVSFDMDFSIGDVIVASVESTSSSEGVAILENLTTGKNVTATASAPSTSATLVGQTAEWILEDLSVDGDGLTLIDFGEAYFTGCVAKAGGKTVNLDGAELYAVEDSTSDHVQAAPTIVSNTELKVTYESS